MRWVKPPDLHGIDCYDSISASKRAPRDACLIALRARIESAYARYRACVPELANCVPLELSTEEREALLHCYLVETDALNSMLAKLPFSRRCPLCNLPGADEWDHYLPSALFPEYAVCPQNLIRTCHRCNNIKLASWRDSDGERLLMHVYYDWIDRGEQLIHAAITVHEGTVRVEYQVRLPSQSGRFRRMGRHITTLHLLGRYQEYAEVEAVPDMLLVVEPKDHVEQVRRRFRRMADGWRKKEGANYWKAALYQAAADSDDFIQHALARVTHD